MIVDKKKYLNELKTLSFTTSSADALILKPSTLPNEIIGVFSTACIEKGSVFGPYVGQFVSANYAHVKKESFSWEVSLLFSFPYF